MSDYLTYEQAAEILGVTYRSVQSYVEKGLLGKKLPSGYILTREEVQNFTPPSLGRPRKSSSAKAAE